MKRKTSSGLAQDSAANQATPFPLGAVRLTHGPFREAFQRTEEKLLLALNPDRLLHTFRVNAGLPSKAKPYGGWEAPDCEIRGFTLGHLLTACSRAFALTGEDKLHQRVTLLVEALAECQQALAATATTPGYLSAFPESTFDRLEEGKRVWAPYYVIHKIMAGLLDAYQHAGCGLALAVLERQAQWLQARMDRLPDGQRQKMLGVEFGGMSLVLADLAAVTGKQRYLDLARLFNHDAVLQPLIEGRDLLDGLHANTQIPKVLGLARQSEMDGTPGGKSAALFFWERVMEHRSYAIGGHGDEEHFFSPDSFGRHLGPATCECCNTHNMLKLARHVFSWKAAAGVLDACENAIVNHILASQCPDSGMLLYFLPLVSGHFKTWSTLEDSFWCCFGTGMETPGRITDLIYWQAENTLCVGLNIASELDWPERGLRLRQETEFPGDGGVRLHFQLQSAQTFTLRLRRPSWAATPPEIRLNGEPFTRETKAGGFFDIRREWRDEDSLELVFPMRLHLETLPGVPEKVAVRHGPVVLAGELGRGDLPESLQATSQLAYRHRPFADAPTLVGSAETVLDALHPVPGESHTFVSRNLGRPSEIRLRPLYEIHDQRYAVYWDLVPEPEWPAFRERMEAERAAQRAEARRIVDSLNPGEQQPETDHAFQGEHTRSGSQLGYHWRDATPGGWFSYDLEIRPDTPQCLRCTWWGSDAWDCEFDILVEGRLLVHEKLSGEKPGEFLQRDYPLPTDLIPNPGSGRVTIRFQPRPGKVVGRLFGCAIVKTGGSIPD